jgi:16S rRNA (guanine527-N7)-methyltransferase
MPGSLDIEPDLTKISQLLRQLCPEVSYSETIVDALHEWLQLLVNWNRRIDLTAARSTDELVDLFLADAVVLHRARLELAPTNSWLDVGSGAGAPGLGMAILDPSLRITLVEPSAKRVAFLRQVVGRLQLTQVQVLCSRAESLSPGLTEEVVSRATWAPGEWFRQATRLTRQRFWVLLARETWQPPAGYRVDYERDYCWPLTAVARRVLAVSPIQPHSER